MYFSVLRKHLGSLEEKGFYNIALMFLTRLGYNDVSIVDGTGDGGRDVTCSREDLRIQLSVRKDWRVKINDEAATTLAIGKRHLLYVTNKEISPADEQKFKQTQLQSRGQVEVSIHDLNRIATSLAQPGAIKRSFEMLGMTLDPHVTASPKEIALSNVLLFGQEARELRESIIEANIKAYLYKHQNASENTISEQISSVLPGADLRKAATSAISRLRSSSQVTGPNDSIRLSQDGREAMEAAELEFTASISDDIDDLIKITRLSREDAKALLEKSIELTSRKRNFDGVGAIEEDLREFIANKGLARRSKKIYDCLSKSSSARRFQFGEAIEHVFSTNTFDIYRALGGRTNVQMVLDTSVSLPLLFGLEFGTARSRFGVAAAALKRICEKHNIDILIPKSYLNEMAAHGLKAVEFLDRFDALPVEGKAALRAGKNAYLSHYAHISDTFSNDGDNLQLDAFLKHFGLKRGSPLRSAENSIRTILESHNIRVGDEPRADRATKIEMSRLKPHDDKIIVEHDAAVAAMLTHKDEKAFIFATWDNTMMDFVENLARVFADTPARVVDHLSMTDGVDYETEQSVEMLTTLLYVDESKAAKLAQKIEAIKTTEQAFRLKGMVDAARQRKRQTSASVTDEMYRLLDEDPSFTAAPSAEEGEPTQDSGQSS